MDLYVWGIGLFISFLVLLFSFVGFKVIKVWIKSIIEKKTLEEIKKYEDYIKNKEEEAFKKITEDIEEKWDERFSKLEEKWDKEYKEHLYKFKEEQFSVGKAISEKTKKELDDFKEKLEKVKEEKDYTFDDWYYKGIGEYDKGEYKNALKSFTKAIELDQDDAEAYIYRGNTFDIQKEYDKALKDYNKALKLVPDYALVYFNRGALYEQQKKYNEALKDYYKAIELDPNDLDPYLCICETQIIAGDINKADDIINKVTSILTEIEHKVIYILLKLIIQKLKDTDTNQTEVDYDNVLKEDFEIDWSFEELDNWLADADISDGKKAFIKDKIDLLKKKEKK